MPKRGRLHILRALACRATADSDGSSSPTAKTMQLMFSVVVARRSGWPLRSPFCNASDRPPRVGHMLLLSGARITKDQKQPGAAEERAADAECRELREPRRDRASTRAPPDDRLSRAEAKSLGKALSQVPIRAGPAGRPGSVAGMTALFSD